MLLAGPPDVVLLGTLEEVAESAVAAVQRADPVGVSGAVDALVQAAQRHNNARRTAAVWVGRVLFPFAQAAHALQAAGSAESAHQLLAALEAGLFAPALSGGHAAAVGVHATARAEAPDEPPSKRRREVNAEDKGASPVSASPQAALLATVCSHVQSGAASQTPLRRACPSSPHTRR